MSTSIITSKRPIQTGGEQARGLRTLVAQRNARGKTIESARRNCHSIVISGGKGGVGRSVIALNLAILFAQRGANVGLLDAATGFGNIELLSGLNGYWNLSHALQGSRELHDVLLTGPAGINILSGASCLTEPSSVPASASNRLIDQLNAFEAKLDWLIVDASSGAASVTGDFALHSDDLLVVTTPETTAIAEAYSTIKSVAAHRRPRIGTLVNQADSAKQSNQILDRLQQAAHSFLQLDLHRRGYLPRDPQIPASVNNRTPFVIQTPESPAAIELSKLAQRWTRPQSPSQTTGFFTRLLNRRK